MLIPIYPLAPGVWTFRVQPGEPILIEVPAGSEALHVKSIGTLLFVPSAFDPRQRMAWSPVELLCEARRPGGRFTLVGAVAA